MNLRASSSASVPAQKRSRPSGPKQSRFMQVYWYTASSCWRYDLKTAENGKRYDKNGFKDEEECARARDAVVRQFYPHLELNFPDTSTAGEGKASSRAAASTTQAVKRRASSYTATRPKRPRSSSQSKSNHKFLVGDRVFVKQWGRDYIYTITRFEGEGLSSVAVLNAADNDAPADAGEDNKVALSKLTLNRCEEEQPHQHHNGRSRLRSGGTRKAAASTTGGPARSKQMASQAQVTEVKKSRLLKE